MRWHENLDDCGFRDQKDSIIILIKSPNKRSVFVFFFNISGGLECSLTLSTVYSLTFLT